MRWKRSANCIVHFLLIKFTQKISIWADATTLKHMRHLRNIKKKILEATGTCEANKGSESSCGVTVWQLNWVTQAILNSVRHALARRLVAEFSTSWSIESTLTFQIWCLISILTNYRRPLYPPKLENAQIFHLQRPQISQNLKNIRQHVVNHIERAVS